MRIFDFRILFKMVYEKKLAGTEGDEDELHRKIFFRFENPTDPPGFRLRQLGRGEKPLSNRV
jgi:hypothetical protein